MRIETAAVATFTTLASASNVENHHDVPKETSNRPWFHSDNDHNYISSSKTLSKQMGSLQDRSFVSPILKNGPVNEVLITKSGADVMDAIGTTDFGILGKRPTPKNEVEGVSSGAPYLEHKLEDTPSRGLSQGDGMLERHLDATAAASFDCETYCASFTSPIIDVS
eukprot:CAMPEP_0172374468 /NCGR_PEP_ID=MMETSP1060-20121228/55953_1 /TAXON_ID=37318 /ORGANISM="Pseudo-nitzschia pungens, Strain cf. cingulata" /LENGTH=165 /DNA_ID=CAMNT_0013101161 /DNA_START=58 /DNA_END=552 /DNA_ORIENTATION=-